MSYNENVISYIHFLEKNIKVGATEKITTLGRELLTKFSNKELNSNQLQAFFEAEGEVIHSLLRQGNQESILSLVQALCSASPNAPGIELQVTTNVLQKEHKDFLLQLHPERKEIMKNVLEGISSFIEPILENPIIKDKWDLAQKILHLEYPTEYRNILELYKIASTNSIGTTYLSKLKETPPPEDLTDKAKVYNSLTNLYKNLDQLKQTIQEDLEEIKREKIDANEGHLRILKNSIEGCFLYLNPVLDQLTERSLTKHINETEDQSLHLVEVQHLQKETKISGDLEETVVNDNGVKS